jgi:predicted nucleic acid-binding protein
MRTILADTSYWVALIDSNDQWHEKATDISKSLSNHSKAIVLSIVLQCS